MVKVFFTVDVEVWCNGWRNLDAEFSSAFQRYMYGPTPTGQYGLPFNLQLLNDHGLQGVFFVEPLFSTRFGAAPLQEVVGLIQDAGQEIQLHLHPEWADEAITPIIDPAPKRPYLWDYSLAEQTALIRKGKELLHSAGVEKVHAFRAGSFGMNHDTLTALREASIPDDSSYDYPRFRTMGTSFSSEPLLSPTALDGVAEYPLSFFEDGPSHYRPLQLGACSSEEMEHLLWHAAENDWPAVVFLSHNFELMNQRKTRSDPVVVGRFRRLCRFLDRHRNVFETSGFQKTPQPEMETVQPHAPKAPLLATMKRHAEQAWRRTYR